MPEPEVSLVLVSYEMGRELPRTLLSLSPGQQRGCPRGRYEVIVVDNGSRRPAEAADFAGLGLDLRVHRWPEPTRSPVAALNFGLGLARAPLIGAWIDGARLASPGLVDACARAARLHPRPVVVTANHHLGPAVQPLSCRDGYGPGREDALLASIDWPRGDGYALFGVSTPVDRGGPAGPMLESNAIFMPRALWDELDGYDPRFGSPGGGATNPDLLIRACALPGAQLIRVLGEATFHQIHGGVTSGDAATVARALIDCSREYYRIRGRPLAPTREPGWLFDPRQDRVLPTAPAA